MFTFNSFSFSTVHFLSSHLMFKFITESVFSLFIRILFSLICRSVFNASRRSLAYLSCRTGNPIDDCWRCDPNWETNRQRLADCAIGFGKNAIGGRDGRIYVVTDPSNDDPVNPRPGTLRYAVTQEERLWIIFKRDMVIRLKKELIITSFKTIDGRGSSVHITNGPCLKIHYATNIIIHGINIHDCKPGSGEPYSTCLI